MLRNVDGPAALLHSGDSDSIGVAPKSWDDWEYLISWEIWWSMGRKNLCGVKLVNLSFLNLLEKLTFSWPDEAQQEFTGPEKRLSFDAPTWRFGTVVDHQWRLDRVTTTPLYNICQWISGFGHCYQDLPSNVERKRISGRNLGSSGGRNPFRGYKITAVWLGRIWNCRWWGSIV